MHGCISDIELESDAEASVTGPALVNVYTIQEMLISVPQVVACLLQGYNMQSDNTVNLSYLSTSLCPSWLAYYRRDLKGLGTIGMNHSPGPI